MPFFSFFSVVYQVWNSLPQFVSYMETTQTPYIHSASTIISMLALIHPSFPMTARTGLLKFTTLYRNRLRALAHSTAPSFVTASTPNEFHYKSARLGLAQITAFVDDRKDLQTEDVLCMLMDAHSFSRDYEAARRVWVSMMAEGGCGLSARATSIVSVGAVARIPYLPNRKQDTRELRYQLHGCSVCSMGEYGLIV